MVVDQDKQKLVNKTANLIDVRKVLLHGASGAACPPARDLAKELIARRGKTFRSEVSRCHLIGYIQAVDDSADQFEWRTCRKYGWRRFRCLFAKSLEPQLSPVYTVIF